MLVSVIIPAKDEEASLPGLLAQFRSLPADRGFDIEIIVVADHCKDRTAEVARAGGARVVENQRSPGKGWALISGFEAAEGELMVMMDADGSHLAEYLPTFVRLLRSDFGLVIGSRQLGGSDEYTFLRALGNIFLSGIFNLITGTRITDVLNGYKGFRRDVFTSYRYRSGEFEIEIELVVNALRRGYRVGEFACHENARDGGVPKSKIVRHGTRFLLKILQLAIPYRLNRPLARSTQA